MLLALYPDVQKRMREEVLQIWPSPDDFASSSYKRDLDKLVRYCNSCTYCISQLILAYHRSTPWLSFEKLCVASRPNPA